MLTKGAIGNLINRYKAVLKKCNLINTFGSLAVASMLVLGGAGVAGATATPVTLEGSLTSYPEKADSYLVSGDATITLESTTGSLFSAKDSKIVISGDTSDGSDSLTVNFGPTNEAHIPFVVNSGSLEITDLGSLVLTGQNFSSDQGVNNAFYSNGSGTLKIAVDTLKVGSESEAAGFIVFAPQGGTMNVEADTVEVYSKSKGLWPQGNANAGGKFTLDAKTIKFNTQDAAFGAANYVADTPNPNETCVVEITATDTIDVVSAAQTATVIDNSTFGTGRGTINMDIKAANDISLKTTGNGKYSVTINRAAAPDEANGLPVSSHLNITSEHGSVTVDSTAMAVRLQASNVNAQVEGSINAAKNIKLSASQQGTIEEGKPRTDGTAVHLQNADLTLKAGGLIDVDATVFGFKVLDDSHLTVNGNTDINVSGTGEAYGVYAADGATVTMGDTNITTNGQESTYAVRANDASVVTLGETTVSAASEKKARGVTAFSGSTLTVGREGGVNTITATATNGTSCGVIANNAGTNLTFTGVTTINAESNGDYVNGLSTGGGYVAGKDTQAHVTFNDDVTINAKAKNASEVNYWTDGVYAADSELTFKGKTTVNVSGDAAFARGMVALGDKKDNTGITTFDFNGDVDIDVTATSEAYGMVLSGGDAAANGTLFDVYAKSENGRATGLMVQHESDSTFSTSANATILAEGNSAIGIDMPEYYGTGSITLNGVSNSITAKGKAEAYAMNFENGATLSTTGATTLAATADDAANAHALYGGGSLTNSGDLTVVSGKLSGFTGTYTQTAGSTDIKGASDFFGGTVAIEGGSLAVGVSQFGEEDSEAKAFAAEIKDVNFAKGSELVVDFAGNPATYTLAQYNDAKKALFGENENAILTFLNTEVEIDEDKDRVLMGADVETTADGKTKANLDFNDVPTRVTEGSSVDDAHKSHGSDHGFANNVVKLVDSSDDKHNLLKPHEVHAQGSEFSAKAIQVAKGSGGEDGLNFKVNGDSGKGSKIVLAGTDKGLFIDENGDAVKTNLEISEGSDLTIGQGKDVNENIQAEVGKANVKGKHTVNGNNGNHYGQTKVKYGEMNIEGKGDVRFLNASSEIGKLTLKAGGRFFIDPAYAKISDAEIDGALVIGAASVAEVGDVADLADHIAKAGLTSKADGTVESGAVLALGKKITIGENGTLTVDPALTTDNIGEVAGAGNGSASFADNTVLVLTNELAQSGAIATEGKDATLEVASSSKLYIVDAKADQKYTIAEGFKVDPDKLEGWKNVISNALTAAHASFDENGNVVISVDQQDAAEALPGVIPATALNSMMASGANNVDTENSGTVPAGIKFLSRAVEPAFVAADARVDTINEVSRAAVTAGVQNTSLRIADAASNTVLGHMSLAAHDGSSAIH
ncbi:beta strand repeat-containing protein, partial [Mailhella sp.]